jgi:hypothetical protein
MRGALEPGLFAPLDPELQAAFIEPEPRGRLLEILDVTP